MIEWVLFICGVAIETQQVRCVLAPAPTEVACKLERDRINEQDVMIAATCFPREKLEDEQGQ